MGWVLIIKNYYYFVGTPGTGIADFVDVDGVDGVDGVG
jgi:hypothetical protein